MDSPPLVGQLVSIAGESLRDKFALAIVQGVMADPECQPESAWDFAKWTYTFADALVAESNKTNR